MAFHRVTTGAGVVLAGAEDEARSGGSGSVEAEHLLLALSTDPALRHVGLDRDQIAAALADEEASSLAVVGVARGDFGSPTASPGRRKPKLATSFKLAVHRAMSTAQGCGDPRLQTRHLLHGVLAAEHGRVPRALRIADIDVAELRARL